MTAASPLEVAAWLAAGPVARAPLGSTPHSVVLRVGAASLRYFPARHATDAAAQQEPLFCVMPLINRWTVFDLMPGRSVVEGLTARGIPVYLLDWGSWGPEAAALPIEHFLDGVLLRALRRACLHAGVPRMAVLGYCVGGTFLAVAAARDSSRMSRALFLAAPIGFGAPTPGGPAEAGRLARWAQPEHFPVDDIVDGFGNFPGDCMTESFRWLRPMGTPAKFRALSKRFHAPGFPELWAALERWNGEAVDFPGEAYRAYIRGCYMQDGLVRGGWFVGGREVRLGDVRIPAIALAAVDDHIVPVASAHALARTWGGPVDCRTLRGGHVGICAGRPLVDAIAGWMAGAEWMAA